MKPDCTATHPSTPNAHSADRRFIGLADFSPAYFGMVMATGIVLIAAHRVGMSTISQALFRLNIIIYAA